MKKFFFTFFLLFVAVATARPADARVTLGVVVDAKEKPGALTRAEVQSFAGRLVEKIQEDITVKELPDAATVVDWRDQYAAIDFALLPQDAVDNYRRRFLFIGPVDSEGRIYLVARQGVRPELTEKAAAIVKTLGHSPWRRSEEIKTVIPGPAEESLSIDAVIEAQTGRRAGQVEQPAVVPKTAVPTARESETQISAELLFALVAGGTVSLQTSEQAEQFAGYLETSLPIKVKVKEFAQLDRFVDWFMRFRMIDLAVVNENEAESNLGRDYETIVEVVTLGADKESKQLLVGRRGQHASLYNQIKNVLLETQQSTDGQKLLTALGIQSFVAPSITRGPLLADIPTGQRPEDAPVTPTTEVVQKPEIRDFLPPVEPVAPEPLIFQPPPDLPEVFAADVPPEPAAPDIVPVVPLSPDSIPAPPSPTEMTGMPLPELPTVEPPAESPMAELPVASQVVAVPEPPTGMTAPESVVSPKLPDVQETVKVPEVPRKPDLPEVFVAEVPPEPAVPDIVPVVPLSPDSIPVPPSPTEMTGMPLPELPAVEPPVESPRAELPVASQVVAVPEPPTGMTAPESVVSPKLPDVRETVKAPEVPQKPELPEAPATYTEPVKPPVTKMDDVGAPVLPVLPSVSVLAETPAEVVAPAEEIAAEVAGQPEVAVEVVSSMETTTAMTELPGGMSGLTTRQDEDQRILEEVLEFADPISPDDAARITPVTVSPEDLDDNDILALLGEDLVATMVAQPEIPQELRPPGIPVIRPGRIVEQKPEIDRGLLLTSLPDTVQQKKPVSPPRLLPDAELDPNVVYIVPFISVMVPKEVKDHIFDTFVDTLIEQSKELDLEFVILKEGLKNVDPRWLEVRKYVTGEIYAYVEEAGSTVIDLRIKAKLDYHKPNLETPAFSYLYPVSKLLDRDAAILEEERIKLADDVAETLINKYLKFLKS